MRRYTCDEEECIRTQNMVREWTRSKLLDPSQGARLEAELRIDLRRTNGLLRVGLALFTTLIVFAAVALVVQEFGITGSRSLAAVTGVSALACIGLAELLVGRFRLYRFGVEEALAVAAVVLLSISGAELAAEPYNRFGEASRIVSLSTGAAGGFWLFRRFGFVYTAVASAACAAAVPFQVDLSATARHLVAALAFAVVFVVARRERLQAQHIYQRDEYGDVQAAAWAGLYLTLNLQLTWEPMAGAFYWCTFALTWVLPYVGFRLSVRSKDRALLDVSIVMALVTVLTNKPYLGWPRYTWDPILLGVLLMAVVVLLRRWLSSGPGGERYGFTSDRLLAKYGEALRMLEAASAAFQPSAQWPPGGPDRSEFGGGRSGGGGASAGF